MSQASTRADRLVILKDIAEKLNEATDVSSAMEAILPRLSDALGLSTAWAFRYDPKRRSFVEVGASGLPPALEANDGAPLKCGTCECQDQFVEGKLHQAVNIVRCSRLRDVEGDTNGLVFHASVPLRSKGKPLGILNLAASGFSVFTEESLALLTTVGHHVAVAVDRAGIIADERRRADQLRCLSDLATELMTLVQPQQILQFAVDQCVAKLGYEACGILQPNPIPHRAAPSVLVSAMRDERTDPSEYTYEPVDDTTPLPPAECLLLDNAASMLVQPIPHTGYVFRLESSLDSAFQEEDRDMLSALAGHVAAALENSRLYDHALRQAKWVERRRLAADLHDAVSQRLFSAQLLINTAKLLSETKESPGPFAETLDRIGQLIADSQHEMRTLIDALRPPDERGIAARLQERIAPLQLQFATRLEFAVDSGSDVTLRLDAREALLKVADEAIANALKHARAKHVQIRLNRTDSTLTLTIRDDGVGFDPLATPQGLGTTTMYDRMYDIGGSLDIHSVIGSGTTVTCCLPADCAVGEETEAGQ